MGLRTRGDMDFGEITDVVPWLETSLDMGVDLRARQKAWPQAFKSHQDWDSVPKGARYIYVIRDPKDVAISFYHFFEGWLFEPGTIDLKTFVEEFLLDGTRSGSYAGHLTSWWPKRNDADTLMLCFEDIVPNLRQAVERVARFCSIDADDATVDIATAQAGIDFMKRHQSHFDDHPIRLARNEISGVPVNAGSTKVRSGKSGHHKAELTPEISARYDEIWREHIAPATGYANYESLRASLRG